VWPRRVVPAPTSAVSMPHNCGAAMRCVSKAGPGYNGAFARTELASSLSKSARYVAVAPIPPAVWIAIVSSIVVVGNEYGGEPSTRGSTSTGCYTRLSDAPPKAGLGS
jgi:hypothetical protein